MNEARCCSLTKPKDTESIQVRVKDADPNMLDCSFWFDCLFDGKFTLYLFGSPLEVIPENEENNYEWRYREV